MTTVNSQYTALTKQLYNRASLENLVMRDHPILGILPKMESLGGDGLPYPTQYANPVAGRSQTFATAQTNSSNTLNSKLIKFLLTATENTQDFKLSSFDVAATEKSEYAFAKLLGNTIDSVFENLSDDIELQLPRDGSKMRGQVSLGSTVGAKTITLADLNDAVFFEVGMRLQACATATNTGGLRDSGAVEVLAGMNRATGVLTATNAAWTTALTALSSSSNTTAGDYLLQEDDSTDGGASGGVFSGIRGFSAWIPSTAPSASESYFGVDRSVDSRLFGFYHDGTAASTTVEEALIDAASKVYQMHRGRPSKALLSPQEFRRLIKELGSKTTYVHVMAQGGDSNQPQVGYDGVQVHGDGKTLEVLSVYAGRARYGYLINPEDWDLCSLGQITRFDDTDGMEVLRQSSSLGIEGRVVSWANLGCKAPGKQAVVYFPA